MEKVLQFIKELSKNNNRGWFEENRDRYQESREKMIFLTEVLINEIREFDPSISAVEAKDCLFRIYRDLRFTKDKSPYKTHFGAFISKEGRKGASPGYYLQIEPDRSIVSGGMYRPDNEQLKKIRNYIARFPEEFDELFNDSEFRTALPEMLDDKLKTAPKGFSKDHEFIHLLRYKSYVFSAPLSDKEITGGNFIETTVAACKQLYRLNILLYDAMADLN